MSFLSSLFGTLGNVAGAVTSALSGSNKVGNAIGSGLSALGGAAAQKNAQDASLEQTKLYNQGQIDLMNTQNQWNLEQWNRENAYNSPTAQLQRLKAAGLNPLFYGLDGNSSATGLQSATANLESGSSAIDRGNSAFANQVQAQTVYQNQVMMSTQKQLLDSEIKKNYADAGYTKQKAEIEQRLAEVEVALKNEQAKLTQAERTQIDANVSKLQSDKAYVEAQKAFTDTQKKQLDIMLQLLPQMRELELQQAKEIIQNYRSQRNLNSAEIDKINATLGLLSAQEDYTKQQNKTEWWRTNNEAYDFKIKRFDYKYNKAIMPSKFFRDQQMNTVGTFAEIFATTMKAVPSVGAFIGK